MLPAEAFVLAGGTVVGTGLADVEIAGGRIVAIGDTSPDATRVDVSGHWLVPAVIDSHVHLAYLPDAEGMADGGVAAAVDLAAPSAFLSEDHGPLRILAAGPMITAPDGYPTQGWGRDGYGLEVSDAEEAVAAVDSLRAAGARIVKLPLDGGPRLSDDALDAVITRARALGMRVAVHALGDADAALGAAIDADVLAHTPTGALSEETVEAWADRAVVSTLGAFGGTDVAVANLSALRDGGATILYGTDFGNTRTAGVDPRELTLLAEAGLSPAEILAATTSAPAAYWGFDGLGALAVGNAASLLVLPTDPVLDPLALSDATLTLIDGAPRDADP
jgi:imidazolonepropionase-like amidohydrolase